MAVQNQLIRVKIKSIVLAISPVRLRMNIMSNNAPTPAIQTKPA